MFLKSALRPINIVVTILMVLSAIAFAYFAIAGGPVINYYETDAAPYLLFSLAIFIVSSLFKWLIATIIKNIV